VLFGHSGSLRTHGLFILQLRLSPNLTPEATVAMPPDGTDGFPLVAAHPQSGYGAENDRNPQ
jgi:hypothetical protein